MERSDKKRWSMLRWSIKSFGFNYNNNLLVGLRLFNGERLFGRVRVNDNSNYVLLEDEFGVKYNIHLADVLCVVTNNGK